MPFLVSLVVVLALQVSLRAGVRLGDLHAVGVACDAAAHDGHERQLVVAAMRADVVPMMMSVFQHALLLFCIRDGSGQ